MISLSTSRERADVAARIASAVVAIVAVILFWPPWHVAAVVPSTERIVTQAGGETGAKPTTVTRTRFTSDDDIVSRTLNDEAAVVLARLGLVLLAAFLTGALVQRLWLAEFAIKLGPLELGALGPEDADELLRSIRNADPQLARRMDELG